MTAPAREEGPHGIVDPRVQALDDIDERFIVLACGIDQVSGFLRGFEQRGFPERLLLRELLEVEPERAMDDIGDVQPGQVGIRNRAHRVQLALGGERLRDQVLVRGDHGAGDRASIPALPRTGAP